MCQYRPLTIAFPFAWWQEGNRDVGHGEFGKSIKLASISFTSFVENCDPMEPAATTDPTDEEREVAQYEDLRSAASRALWTIDLQIRRLRDFAVDLESGNQFVLQQVSDAEFLILSLERLLAVSRLIDPMTAGSLQPAIADFENELPNLRLARNVISHIDEYLSGKGNDKSVRVGAISTSLFGHDIVEYSGFEFNLDTARTVAEALFKAIQSNVPISVKNRIEYVAKMRR